MTKKTERRCPTCAKPIDLHLAFCRQHWFELPKSLREPIAIAVKRKNFMARANAIKAGLDWFLDKRLHAISTEGR